MFTKSFVRQLAFLVIPTFVIAGDVLTFVDMYKDDIGGVDGLNGAISVAVSSDGKHVYAAGEVDDAVAVFSRNTTTGTLTFVEVHKDGVNYVNGLDGVRGVTVSPDDKNVYAVGYDEDALAVFSRNTTTGELVFVEVHWDGVGGVDGLYRAISVIVSPDNMHVYAAGYSDKAVAVFNRNTTTGALTFVEVHKDGVGGVNGLNTVRSVSVSPGDEHVYTAASSTTVGYDTGYPIDTWYHDQKHQSLYLASDLLEAGIPAGAIITDVALKVANTRQRPSKFPDCRRHQPWGKHCLPLLDLLCNRGWLP